MRKVWTFMTALGLGFGTLGLGTPGFVSMASAGETPVVVELFTSQGCSSCPAADEILAELGARDDVIPLALHVDYWDYIGWKDNFGRREFTARQKRYAHANGWRTIYTPQMVVNGTHDVVGSRPMKLAETIQKHAMAPDRVDLDISRQGDTLRIKARALKEMPPCDVVVLRYIPEQESKIERGENAGHTLRYTHIVNGWDVIGKWDGAQALDTTVALNGNEPVVVLIQEPGQGAIVAAARLR